MTYETISQKIKACQTEADLFDTRALINAYKHTSNGAPGLQHLQQLHANMSRKLAKAKTHTRLNY